jgi:nicotinamide-nucleotide amidase
MSVAEELADQLTSRNWTVAVAESCTGGLIGHLITSVPGSSAYFQGTITTYSDTTKMEILGVPIECLRNHGAVSKRTALAMASGVRDVFRVDIGIGVTGIAGPGGGSEQKPVGLVFIAVVGETDETVKELNLSGTREEIKTASAETALKIACDFLDAQEQ